MNGELYTAIGFPPAEQSVCRPADDDHAKSLGRMICTELMSNYLIQGLPKLKDLFCDILL